MIHDVPQVCHQPEGWQPIGRSTEQKSASNPEEGLAPEEATAALDKCRRTAEAKNKEGDKSCTTLAMRRQASKKPDAAKQVPVDSRC